MLALDFGSTNLAAAVIDLEAERIVSPIIRQKTPVVEGANGDTQIDDQMWKASISYFVSNPIGKSGWHQFWWIGTCRSAKSSAF